MFFVVEEDNVDYSWIGLNSFIVDIREIMALDFGIYVIMILFIDSGCSVMDFIIIDIDIMFLFILASFGIDFVFVGCNDVANLNGFVVEDIVDYIV